MCIIVDVNTFSDVFIPSSAYYKHFSPIEKHITSGKSKLIIGGTKFINELSYREVLVELKRANKLVVADKSAVDSLHRKIEHAITDPKFNDQHIVALSCVSRARLVCTKDINLQKHLRNRAFYNRGIDRPNIYNEKSPLSTIPSGSFVKKCLLCK